MMPPAARVALRILQYQLSDIVRSRWLIGYALFFFLVTDVLLRFSGGSRALLGLTNIVLLVIPLVTLIIATIYIYNARNFIELLLAQPVRRGELFGGLALGLVVPLGAAYAAGVGLPIVLHGLSDPEIGRLAGSLIGAGIALTAVFTAIALCIAVRIDDKARGLGAAVAVWLLVAVLYDGVILLLATVFASYPLERPLLVLMLANPVDLARVLLLLQFDASALMGYTGAVFARFFGGSGWVLALLSIAAWIAAPGWLGVRAFSRKDF